jgi:L-lactate utilization protein LutC
MSRSYDQVASESEITATAKALTKNGFEVQVVDSKTAAKQAVVAMVPKGTEVFTATSVTLDETGIAEELNGPEYVSLRNKMSAFWGQEDKKKEMKRVVAAPEVVLGSVHAITRDGKLMIASNTGSQLPSEAYTADKVIFVVGAQKLVTDVADGIKRIEEHSVPLEDVRAQAAYGVHTNFRKLLVINNEMPGRITIVIVKETLGY